MKDNGPGYIFLQNITSEKSVWLLRYMSWKLKFRFCNPYCVFKTPLSSAPNLHHYDHWIRPATKPSYQPKKCGTDRHGSNPLLKHSARCEKPLKKWHLEFASPSGDYLTFLSTDADSNTDTTVGWTKNTPKPFFFFKEKKSSKTQKLKNF